MKLDVTKMQAIVPRPTPSRFYGILTNKWRKQVRNVFRISERVDAQRVSDMLDDADSWDPRSVPEIIADDLRGAVFHDLGDE